MQLRNSVKLKIAELCCHTNDNDMSTAEVLKYLFVVRVMSSVKGWFVEKLVAPARGMGTADLMVSVGLLIFIFSMEK